MPRPAFLLGVRLDSEHDLSIREMMVVANSILNGGKHHNLAKDWYVGLSVFLHVVI